MTDDHETADPDSASEEPTAVRETADDFAHKKTALSLEEGLGPEEEAELQRLRQSTAGRRTPKTNELPALLKELREQRLAELANRERHDTLKSGEKAPDSALDPEPSETPAPAARRSRWALVAGAMAAGGLLVGVGFAVRGWVAAPSTERVRLQLQVTPDDATVRVDGESAPTRGAIERSCEGQVRISIEAPGHVKERHHIPCGSQAVLHVDLEPQP